MATRDQSALVTGSTAVDKCLSTTLSRTTPYDSSDRSKSIGVRILRAGAGPGRRRVGRGVVVVERGRRPR